MLKYSKLNFVFKLDLVWKVLKRKKGQKGEEGSYLKICLVGEVSGGEGRGDKIDKNI